MATLSDEVLVYIGEHLQSFTEVSNLGRAIRESGGRAPDELFGTYYLRSGYPAPPGSNEALLRPWRSTRDRFERGTKCPPHPNSSQGGSWTRELIGINNSCNRVRRSVPAIFDTPIDPSAFNQSPENPDYNRIPHDFLKLAQATDDSLREITSLDLTHNFFTRLENEDELPPLITLSQTFVRDLFRLCVDLRYLYLPHPAHLNAIDFPINKLRDLGIAKRGPVSQRGLSLDLRMFPMLGKLRLYGFEHVSISSPLAVNYFDFHASPGANTIDFGNTTVQEIDIYGPRTFSRQPAPFSLSIENYPAGETLQELRVSVKATSPVHLFSIPRELLEAANTDELNYIFLKGVEIPLGSDGIRRLDLGHASPEHVALESCLVDEIVVQREGPSVFVQNCGNAVVRYA